MQAKREGNQQVNYYIVIRPFLVSKNLASGEINFIFEKAAEYITQRTGVSVFTTKSDAELVASQFTRGEVPADYAKYQDTQDLVKPIICIPLDHPLDLSHGGNTTSYISKSSFFRRNKIRQVTSFPIKTADLTQWQETDWTVFINKRELHRPEEKKEESISLSQ